MTAAASVPATRPAYIVSAHLMLPCPNDPREWHAGSVLLATGEIHWCGACGYMPTAERVAEARLALGLAEAA